MRPLRIVTSVLLIVAIFALTRIRLSHSELDNMPGVDPRPIQWVQLVPLPR
jgi:hypothetical protein